MTVHSGNVKNQEIKPEGIPGSYFIDNDNIVQHAIDQDSINLPKCQKLRNLPCVFAPPCQQYDAFSPGSTLSLPLSNVLIKLLMTFIEIRPPCIIR